MEPCTKVSGEDVQQTTLEGGKGEELQSLHVDGHLTVTLCTTVGGYTLPCHETLTPMDVCGSSYQPLGWKTKAMLIMIEMSMKK